MNSKINPIFSSSVLLNLDIFRLCILFASIIFFSSSENARKVDNLKYVDPQIGGVAPFLQPTRTQMHIPNAMVRMYPDRKDYRNDQIRS